MTSEEFGHLTEDKNVDLLRTIVKRYNDYLFVLSIINYRDQPSIFPYESILKASTEYFEWLLSFYCMKPSNIKAPKCTLFSRVKGHKGSPVLPRLLPSIIMGSLIRRAHFKSLRAAEAKNVATINQLKYCSRLCIT